MKAKKYPKGKALGNTTSMAVASMGVEPKPIKRSRAKIGKGSSKMPTYAMVHKSVMKSKGY